MTWTLQSSPFGSTQIEKVAYGNGLYVAVGFSGQLATSTDGVSWTLRDSQFGTDLIRGVAYGNNLWIIVGFNGQLSISSDGLTWSSIDPTLLSGAGLQDVCYGNGTWVVVGSVGLVATSPDGINWTQRSPGFGTTDVNAVHYDNNLWVIGGGSGKLATSTNGISWTIRTSGFGTSFIYGVDYGAGKWIAVGASGKLITSTDGITWTIRTSGFGTSAIYNSVYADGLWSIVGASGKIATSSDGITWALQSNAMTGAIRGICAGGMLVAVGESGQIQTYPLTLPVQLTPLQGMIQIVGLDWSRAYSDTAAPLSIFLLGGAPKTHLDTFKKAPQLADLTILGFIPALKTGLKLTPLRKNCTLSGLTAVFSNRLLYPVSNGWIKTRYLCVLTGSADGLNDLALPIKSFQTRFASNYIYFSAVIPGVDVYQASITARSNGRLIVWRIYDFFDKSEERFVIASVPFETLRVDSGGRSGLTGTLSGNEYKTDVTPQTLSLFDPVYYSSTSTGKRRYRCALDPRLRVGDLALIGQDAITVGSIVQIVDVKSTFMEVEEA
jgi:hypothetical protein